jgi:hypothetical protein
MAYLQIKNNSYRSTKQYNKTNYKFLSPSSLWLYTICQRNHFCKIISYFLQSSGPHSPLVT